MLPYWRLFCMKKIKIRGYKSDEALFIWQLKFNTIRHINLRDYTAAQVAAWAPDSLDMAAWQQHLDVMNPFIAELDGHIVGFADLQDDGYIDHFFVIATIKEWELGEY